MSVKIDDLINGPWTSDFEKYPNDIYQFKCDKTGYNCEIRRNEFFCYCGYVQLPTNHKDCNKNFEDLDYVVVHGGLTFGGNGLFGFDHNHYNDICPLHETIDHNNGIALPISKRHNAKFYTFDEVKKEVLSLAEQFKLNE